MKKLMALLLFGSLLLSLTACGLNGENSGGTPSGSGSDTPSQVSSSQQSIASQDNSSPTSNGEKTSLDLSDWSKLPEPDEIVYFHERKEDHFTKGTTEYAKIFSLNQARCNRVIDLDFELLQTSFTPEEYIEDGYFLLEYRYKEYNSVYFSLKPDMDSTCWISTERSWGKYARGQGMYGDLPEPTELLAYLDSLD